MPGRFKVKIESDNNEETAGQARNLEQTAEEIAELTAEEAAQAAVEDIEGMIRHLEDERQRLQAELEAAQQAIDDEKNGRLRALADFANYKKRQQEEHEYRVQSATQDLILRMLPVIDNFERAIQAAQKNRHFDALAEGVILTLKQLQELLQKEGVEPIEAVGQEFDPAYHEAVMRVESEELPENTVVEELEKGYVQGARVIRPSRVKVATR